MKTDLAERIYKYKLCLSQIPQILSEKLTEASIFQTLSRRSLREDVSETLFRISATSLRDFEKSQTLSDQLTKRMNYDRVERI